MAKLGLALGGGGARGLAHIGVLKALEKESIKIDAITGCSMGAIVGGLYAYYGNANDVQKHLFEILQNPKFKDLKIEDLVENMSGSPKNILDEIIQYIGLRITAFKSLQNISYFSEEVTEEIYSKIPDVKIEDLKINFSAIATDLISGEEINLTRGSLRKVVRASSAIPGFFPPVKIDDYYLVDGSASESVPVGKVREIGADRVLAVDVTHTLKRIDKPINVVDVLNRAEDITSFHLSTERLKSADLVIRPKVRKLSWADFRKADKIILKGTEAVANKIEEIRKLVNRNSYLLEIEKYIKKLSS
jgi:NTE family protein